MYLYVGFYRAMLVIEESVVLRFYIKITELQSTAITRNVAIVIAIVMCIVILVEFFDYSQEL